jgi:V-type H+-transporting ATPase subunit G
LTVTKATVTDIAQHTQGNKQAEDEANKEAETRIKDIREAGNKNQQKVISDLLTAVFDVKPNAPQVVA